MKDIVSMLNKANNLFSVGNMGGAIELYLEALKIEPENLVGLNALGTAYLVEKNYEKSLVFINLALKIDAKSVIANSNLGFIFMEQGKYPEAAKHLISALEGEPDKAFLWNDLGNAFYKMNKLNEAKECYEKAVKIDPKFSDAYLGLGSIFVKQGKYQEAADYFTKVFSLDPQRVEICYELAHLYFYEIRDIDKALYYVKKLLALNPDFKRARMIQAEIELITGKFSTGFTLYSENRHIYINPKEKSVVDRFFESIPMWRGEIFSGKRLIIENNAGFNGFGDLIMLFRYLPEIKRRGGYITFPVPAELYRLFERSKDVDEIIPYNVFNKLDFSQSKFDFKVPLIILPEIFGSTLNTIPAKIPYLPLDEALVNEWKARITTDALFKVGLVWAGNSQKTTVLNNRLFEFNLLEPFKNIPNVTYYSLQIGKEFEKNSCSEFKSDMIDLTCYIKDFADTAAFIQNLDLVISIDTAVAHLAGALGKPVWLILPFCADWRWLLNRTDSPWYPTMRIFRSKKNGDWKNVLNEVYTNLSIHVKNIRQEKTRESGSSVLIN